MTRRTLITDRDRLLLELLAEHRVLVVPHVQLLLGVSASAAEGRLRELAVAGLVGAERVFAGQPAAAWITRRGLSAIESRLPAPRLDLKGYRHDVGLGWLWLAGREGAFGALEWQRSERVMRAEDGRPGRQEPPHGVGLGGVGPRGGEKLHYPDLVLQTATGHRIAVELELTSKSARRLDQIMLGYACERRIDRVLYLCPPGRVAGSVRDAARRAGLSDLVRVQLLASGSPAGAPQPGRASEGVPAASRTGARRELGR